MSALAVWRVTHLLVSEDGPGDIIFRLRSRLGNRALGRMMDCYYCLSVWFALPFALAVADGWLDRLVGWLALSGAACLLERATEHGGSKQRDEVTHAMLRSETGGFSDTRAHDSWR
jgi:hypothetical protein